MGSQPPADKPATKHEPLVSETLKEGARRNLENAQRDTERSKRMDEAEDRMHEDPRTGSGSE
jgi:hypothetical protein